MQGEHERRCGTQALEARTRAIMDNLDYYKNIDDPTIKNLFEIYDANPSEGKKEILAGRIDLYNQWR